MSRPRYEDSNNYDEETHTLLTGSGPGTKKEKKKLLLIALFMLLLTTVIIGIVASYIIVSNAPPKRKRNVILMISDGFGPASETFARSYYQYINDLPYNYTAPLDQIHVGASRTRSSDSLVTDSAAGATAFSCALKSYNGAIGVDPNQVPCGTILESAKAHGMLTGLVVTSRITHATPACFSAHVVSRDMESEIAVQQIGDYPLGRQVDLMFGGGRCFFMANSTDDSCRTDDRDVVSDAKKRGFKYLTTREEFESIKKEKDSLPIIGLFTLDHMSYEIDRDSSIEPSLKEMSEKALSLLEEATSDSDRGFFLMIEGSRIDMAGHSNDAATHAHEILAYQDTIAAVRAYVDSHPDTVMISVSDHETGGLTLGRQNHPTYPIYLWYPDVIARVQNSAFLLGQKLLNYVKGDKLEFIKKTILADGLGINDFTEEELRFLNTPQDDPQIYEFFLSNLTSYRAKIGWTTHGHTGVDVNLYAYGSESDRLRGNHENTQIGDFITEFLGLDLVSVTEKLNKDNTSFHLNNIDLTRFNVDKLQHYHHDHNS